MEYSEDTNGVLRNRKSKTDKQYLGKKKGNNDLHSTTQNIKARETRAPQKAGDKLICPGMSPGLAPLVRLVMLL